MKNVTKFEETRKGVESFKESTDYIFEEAGRKLEEKGCSSKVYQRAFIKSLQITTLTINQERGLVVFERPNIGSYTHPIYTKKRRINVIPICVLVQMYKESIVRIPEAKVSEIPFTLKGFWKMDKAIDCVSDLTKVRNQIARNMQTLMHVVELQDKGRTAKLLPHLQKVNASITDIKVSDAAVDGFIELEYGEERFKLNISNTKVNVVPLCIILCKYYMNVVKSIEEALETINTSFERNRLKQVLKNLRIFMEKSFSLVIF